ncbi:hypothetical protein DBR17_17745 [Sphingomonas sp. HMWF008]|nr:hypothetical protein DBR17_17745 [Sphingomonas sp. HMWF008]
MANPNQVTGRAKVTIDGALLFTAGDTTLEPGGIKREAVEGDYVAGSWRQGGLMPAKIEVSMLARKDFDPIAFGAIEDATVMVQFDTGQTFVIRQAWSEGPPTMATNDGKSKGVLYGQPAEKVK